MTPAETKRPSPIGFPDAIGIAGLCGTLLLLACFRSRGRMFWGDEIMGLLVLRQPTFAATLHLWRDGIDSSGIWFYVFGRPWLQLFGFNETALRMFSATGVAIAAATIWLAARRYYPLLVVAPAVMFIFSAVGTLRWQLANGRTYGLLLAACALVISMLLRGEDESAAQPTPAFLLATFAAYALLAGSHFLGALYVAAFLATQIALDLTARRRRPRLYLSAAASLLVVLFSRAQIISTAALGKPSYWTIRPKFTDLIRSAELFNLPTLAVFAVVFACGIIYRRFRPERRPVYVILLGFAGLDLFMFALSRVSTSLYVNRYLLPLIFAAILLLCELLAQLYDAPAPLPNLRRVALPALIAVIALALFFYPRLQRTWLPIPDYTDRLLAQIPANLPIVDADTPTFVEVQFYHHDTRPQPLLYPVDWPVALDPANTGGVSGPHEMDNFKKDSLYAEDILPTAEILQRYPDFAVLTSAPDLWLKTRILADPRYTATHQQDFTIPGTATPLEIWLVHRL